jgi:hypothetical protein
VFGVCFCFLRFSVFLCECAITCRALYLDAIAGGFGQGGDDGGRRRWSLLSPGLVEV